MGNQPAQAQHELQLWAAYKAQPNLDLRLQLIEIYTPTAIAIAKKIHRKLLQSLVEFNDLLHYAMIGLIESLERYDPTEEASFPTFAQYRIQGAILNQLANQTEIYAQLDMQKRAKAKRHALLNELSTSSSSNPEALFLEMVELSLGLSIGYMLAGTDLYQTEDENTEYKELTAYEHVELQELSKHLAGFISYLPQKERVVIRHLYFFGFSNQEVADLLGLTKGRVSQLNRQGLAQLRKMFEANKIDMTL